MPLICWVLREAEWGWDRDSRDDSRECKETAEPIRGMGGVDRGRKKENEAGAATEGEDDDDMKEAEGRTRSLGRHSGTQETQAILLTGEKRARAHKPG